MKLHPWCRRLWSEVVGRRGRQHTRRGLRELQPQWSSETLEPRDLLTTAHFGVIGDFGSAGTPEADVANLVKSWNPEFIITVGDNNYDTGSAATIDPNIGQYYHDFIGNYTGSYGAGSATNRFFPSLGNHDWGTKSGSPALPTPYLNYFTLPGNERYYSFSAGPIDFFAIDSDPSEPDGTSSTSTQALWLQAQLAASTAPWQVVYFHHAAYSSGSHGSNTTMQWPFQAWGADLIMTGHDHTYERLNVNGLPYFVNGLGGKSIYTFTSALPQSQVRYGADFGAMLVDATDTTIHLQFVTRTNQLIDSYTLDKVNALPEVSVTATDAAAAEAASDPGTFTITRTGDTSQPLTVGYTLSGTAANGTDYATLTGSVTIAALATSATVTVTPVDDVATEATETVKLTLAGSTTFNFTANSNATVQITDNDATTTTFVPTGASWKYLDNGTNQGTAWIASGFSDGSWASGAAELGYGDGDEVTTVSYGSNASAKYITTYFRKSFDVTNPAAIINSTLRLLRDDGAVVYLNGVEVARSNMPTGTVTYTTLASAAIDDATFYSFSVSPSRFVAGTNVLAVEIHQANATSSDISFNLDLTATLDSIPPAVPTVPDLDLASDTGLDDDDDVTADTTPTFTGTAEASSTVTIYSDGVAVGSGTATGGAYSITISALSSGTRAITAKATDAAGNSSAVSAALNVIIDTAAPTADIVDVSPDPRTTSVTSITISYTEPVFGFDLADLSLTKDGGSNLLTASQTLSTTDNQSFVLSDLSSLTSADGVYTLTLTAAGIADQSGNALSSGANDTFTVGTPPPLPEVSIVANDANAAEPGTDNGLFTISRTGSTASALTVTVSISGTATNGTDYSTIANSVTIAAGSASATVQVSPTDDTLLEGTESVVLTVIANAAYTIGTANAGTVSLADNEVNLIPKGSANWKYLDNGTNQGTAWRATSFNDTAWKTGTAQLGYGDGDEATVVSYGSNASKKHITTYLRKSFTVSNAANITAATLNLLRDDGAVVYVNGTEVFRSNMPGGSISYTTKASTAIDGAGESTYYSQSVSLSRFVTGTNVIAVEIHQNSGSSSDISFDLQLIVSTNSGAAPAAPANSSSIAASPQLANTAVTTGTSEYRLITAISTDHWSASHRASDLATHSGSSTSQELPLPLSEDAASVHLRPRPSHHVADRLFELWNELLASGI